MKTIFNPLLPSNLQKVASTGEDITRGTLDVDKVQIKSPTGVNALEVKDGTTDKIVLKWAGNTATLDVPSPEPDNKITNGTFETDLSSWSEVPSYTLNDQFTTDLAAGAVNGTSAEPTGGTRTVVDTNSKLSITGGQLSFATGGVGYGNPGIWYPSLTRAAGKTLLGTLNFTAFDEFYLGFDTNQTSTASENSFSYNGGVKTTNGGTLSSLVTEALSTGTNYNLAVVLRSTGAFYYIKGGTFTNWTLLWMDSTQNTATLYPSISGKVLSVFTADNIRIPTATWLPTPLAYDTFTRADGAIGSSETTGPDSQTTPSLAWTGGAISSNTNVITPTEGSDIVVDGGLENWTSATNLTSWAETIAGTSTINQETSVIHGGSNAARFDIGASNSNAYFLPVTGNAVTGGWYAGRVWAKANAGTPTLTIGHPSGISKDHTLSTTYAQYLTTYRAINPASIFVGRGSAASTSLYIDDITVQPLTLSSLFSSVSTSDADVIAGVTISSLTSGTQGGLVLNLDSTSSPANFIIVYHDGITLKVDEAVAGVYTNKQSTTVALGAGALRVVRDGTKLRAYLNNALVGSELTMTANTNTKHGIFSTYASNTFDDFTLWARGTGTTKFTNAPFEELTPTRDTTTKYAGAASAKLVAGGTDANFLQSVTLPDTATYTLIAYAYTTGAAVTTADLDLYYDTGVLSTTFTSVGSGWYKLTGTLTGVASSKSYGVRVHAGKTVYVDSFSLQAGSGVTTTFEILNSGTGNVQHTVEGRSTLNAGVATEQALIVKGAASQTENLLDLQDSTGAKLSGFDKDGKFVGSVTGVASLNVLANGAISGATKTKITYDAKGLVTTGADATTADIAESTDKKYVTNAQETALDAGVDATVTYVDTLLGAKTLTFTKGILTAQT